MRELLRKSQRRSDDRETERTQQIHRINSTDDPSISEHKKVIEERHKKNKISMDETSSGIQEVKNKYLQKKTMEIVNRYKGEKAVAYAAILQNQIQVFKNVLRMHYLDFT